MTRSRVLAETDHNPRKARRDKRRVPKLSKADIPPIAELPVSDQPYWRMGGRERQIGREQCIAEGRHALVRSERGWIRVGHPGMWYAVFCGRCGAYAGSVSDDAS